MYITWLEILATIRTLGYSYKPRKHIIIHQSSRNSLQRSRQTATRDIKDGWPDACQDRIDVEGSKATRRLCGVRDRAILNGNAIREQSGGAREPNDILKKTPRFTALFSLLLGNDRGKSSARKCLHRSNKVWRLSFEFAWLPHWRWVQVKVFVEKECLVLTYPQTRFYLTTAIAYTNGQPHIGHAYEFITADVLGNFETLYLYFNLIWFNI